MKMDYSKNEYEKRKREIYEQKLPKTVLDTIIIEILKHKGDDTTVYVFLRRMTGGFTVKLTLQETLRLCSIKENDYKFIETIKNTIKDRRVKKIKPVYNKFFLSDTRSFLTKNPSTDTYYLKKLDINSFKFFTIQLTKREISSIKNCMDRIKNILN